MNAAARERISASMKAKWAQRRLAKKGIAPAELLPLPEGVSVGQRPEMFDLYRKGRGTGDKWIAYYQRLVGLGATESLRFDLSKVDDVKKSTQAIIVGIRSTARSAGFHKPIKHALIGSTLHITI